MDNLLDIVQTFNKSTTERVKKMLPKKLLFGFLFTLFITSTVTIVDVTAYEEDHVHPYLTGEAAKLFEEWIDANPDWLTLYPAAVEVQEYLPFILAGARHEDLFDHIYDFKIKTITHFWDADAGDDDLVKAQGALAGLIDRINHESRQRFVTTFDAVRGHFQELFRKLFGGGKADVFLEGEEDVLEAGIEVVARPPGKQLQRISLLSGGEKTMTAVALLLAIFRARPSPFAILDEVDAALDESNVDRFTDLVKEFLDQSQFVIISHNKRTMAIADVLYGVTMQEPGVSRRVSVKFSDLHEHGYVAQESDRPEAEADRLPVETEAALSAAGARAAKERDASAEAEPSEFAEEPEEQVPAPQVEAESPVTT